MKFVIILLSVSITVQCRGSHSHGSHGGGGHSHSSGGHSHSSSGHSHFSSGSSHTHTGHAPSGHITLGHVHSHSHSPGITHPASGHYHVHGIHHHHVYPIVQPIISVQTQQVFPYSSAYDNQLPLSTDNNEEDGAGDYSGSSDLENEIQNLIASLPAPISPESCQPCVKYLCNSMDHTTGVMGNLSNPSQLNSVASPNNTNNITIGPGSDCGGSDLHTGNWTDPLNLAPGIGQSELDQFPWTVAVFQKGNKLGIGNDTRNRFLCGGSLIHPQVVLTAAHCVFHIANSWRKELLKVRIGKWDASPTEFQDLDVKHVRWVEIHEQLYRKEFFNDVALLFLETLVDSAITNTTICLASTTKPGSSFDNKGLSCAFHAWAKDNSSTWESTVRGPLKSVSLSPTQKKECESKFHKTRLGEEFRLHESLICGNGEHLGNVCVADGGFPLVCKHQQLQTLVQIGIASWGFGCGADTPGVYANVAKFETWIYNKLAVNKLQAKFCSI